jgi:hypothetical protein
VFFEAIDDSPNAIIPSVLKVTGGIFAAGENKTGIEFVSTFQIARQRYFDTRRLQNTINF